jgi:hypothetical protein
MKPKGTQSSSQKHTTGCYIEPKVTKPKIMPTFQVIFKTNRRLSEKIKTGTSYTLNKRYNHLPITLTHIVISMEDIKL